MAATRPPATACWENTVHASAARAGTSQAERANTPRRNPARRLRAKAPAAMPTMPGSANASAAIMAGSFPDHISGPTMSVTWAPDANSAADTTTTAQSTPHTAVAPTIAARRAVCPDTSIGHGMSGSARSERATFCA